MNINRLITQSGRSKAGFLSDQALLQGALMVGVCETWLDPGIQVFSMTSQATLSSGVTE